MHELNLPAVDIGHFLHEFDVMAHKLPILFHRKRTVVTRRSDTENLLLHDVVQTVAGASGSHSTECQGTQKR